MPPLEAHNTTRPLFADRYPKRPAYVRSPLRQEIRARPQATHRAMMDEPCTEHQWMAQKVPFAQRQVRTRTMLVDETRPQKVVRFSAAYCPPVYGVSIFAGMPRLLQPEHLAYFAVLKRYNGRYINITTLVTAEQMEILQEYALPLYREAFAHGRLR